MKHLLGALGFILTVVGISGTIDHLWHQPILGAVLNRLNQDVFSTVGWFAGHELFANLIVVVLGVVVIAMSERLPHNGS